MYKKLFSDSAVYGLGSILAKSIGFFTLPIYTHIFSPSDYGIIEMFSTISGILAVFMTMGLDSTQSYYFMEAKNKNNANTKEIISSILALRLIIGLAVVALATLFASLIITFIFTIKIPTSYFLMTLVSTFFATLISQSLEIFRLLYKPWQYISLTLTQTLMGVGFVLYFVYFNHYGLHGYFLGALISSAIALLISWTATRGYWHYSMLNIALWKKFLHYGIPLIPASIMVWIMNASDRWFILNMLSEAQLGLFAVAAKFALMIMLAVQTFRQAWWPIAMDMVHKPEGPVFFKTVALWYVVLGSLGSLALTVISPYLIKFLVPETYYECWKLVGIMSWTSIFYGFYLISTIGVFVSKKTYLNIYIHGVGGVLNIILNYLMILQFGLIGAAIATSVSILVSNIYGMILSNKYYYISWDWLYYAVSILISWLLIFWYVDMI